MEAKVAVLGDADFVMPFSALGLDKFEAGDNTEQAVKAATSIIEGKYALVVVAENIAPMVENVFSDYQSSPVPCVLVVPFTKEPTGYAISALRETIKRSTGVNILTGEDDT